MLESSILDMLFLTGLFLLSKALVIFRHDGLETQNVYGLCFLLYIVQCI